MKPIAEVYPPDPDGTWWEPADYTPLLESFGHDIALRADDEDYQGSSYLLLRDGERWGLLIFGWGSCSGCDALQDCRTLAEVDELREQIHNDIHWEPDRAAMHRYLSGKDWETEWSWHEAAGRQFVADAIALTAAPQPA